MDWILVGAVGVLCVAGGFSAYAATVHNPAGKAGGSTYLVRDVMNIGVGCALASPAFLVDYRKLRAYAPLVYAAVCALLLVVLSPFGRVINGARAWFVFGPVQLEPSEFAKIAVIVTVAALLTEPREGSTDSGRDTLLALGAAGLPIALILAEPALGVALVVGAVAVSVLVISGTPARYVLGLITAAVIGVAIVLGAHLLKPYQEQRFTYFVDQNVADSSTGYQIQQSQIAIGAGGLTGEGLLHGAQTNGGFVPEQQTDFVFTVLAEESGFLGAGALLLVYSVVLTRAGRIARRASDMLGTAIASGITLWLGLQAFVNIGMALGIAPVTGVPLPFVSYGGSSMLADLIATALLLNIGVRSASEY